MDSQDERQLDKRWKRYCNHAEHASGADWQRGERSRDIDSGPDCWVARVGDVGGCSSPYTSLEEQFAKYKYSTCALCTQRDALLHFRYLSNLPPSVYSRGLNAWTVPVNLAPD